ncbi:MAG: phytanoyl-CoA dioxygenase family protein [Microthrixaceae bacterium]|nr:phytanoyl-CoA dioxygenase family protein [Microthrixaceae bacterium]
MDAKPDLRGAFAESGMIVLRAVVDPELCMRVRESVAPWARRRPRLGEKYQDAWMRHRPVRELACHRRIMTELEGLYGRRPIPFQTLNIAHGTQQRLHADSVHFDSVPSGWMCGAWVALEDVGADQGPLVLVPGSHRVAPTVFDEVAERPSGFDMAAYETALGERLASAATEEFHASAGDVVIWHADLAHGGATVKDPASSRWSQVTHYFFDGFTYVTPMLGDRHSGELHVRAPLVDIARRRIVPQRMNGRRARVVRLGNGRAIVSSGARNDLTPTVRAASVLRSAWPTHGWPRVWAGL